MVGIITGNTGFSQSTATDSGLLNKDSTSGQTLGNVAVNVARRNLALEFVDETLSVAGQDIQHARYSYSQQSLQDDSDNDGWTNGVRRIVETSAQTDQFGTYITYVARDGASAKAYWDAGTGAYLYKAGSGAYDRITFKSAASNLPDEWVVTDGDTQSQEFVTVSTGKIARMRDTSDNGFDYAYGSNGLISTITDVRSGSVFFHHYNEDNRLDYIAINTSPEIKEVIYIYDGNGRLQKVKTLKSTDGTLPHGTDADYFITTYTYAGNTKNVSKIEQSDGTRVDIEYYANGDVFKVTDRSGVTQFEYFTASTKVTDGSGNATNYDFDTNGQIKKITSASVNGVNQSISYGYDTAGNITSITDGKGNVTERRYDSNGNLIRQRDAEGNFLSRQYDATNNLNLVSETRYKATTSSIDITPSDTEAATTRYVYDDKSRLRFTISAEGRVTENVYTGIANSNAFGLVAQTKAYRMKFYNVASLNPTSQLTLINLTDWVTGLTPDEKRNVLLTEFDYDGLGNLSFKRAFGAVSDSGVGVIESATDHSLLNTKYVYDQHGQLLQTLQFNAFNNTSVEQVNYVYDGVGRRIQVIDQSGTTSISYDTQGQVTYFKLQDKLSDQPQNQYMISIHGFDNRGKAINVIENYGQLEGTPSRQTVYQYNSAGRLYRTTGSDGADLSYLFYNAAGQVSHKVDGMGALTEYVYDANGRVFKEIRYATPITTASFTTTTTGSDISAIIATHLFPAYDRSVTYSYDNAGRLTQVDESGYSTTVEGSNAQPHLITKTEYNGLSQVTKTTQVASVAANNRVTEFYYDKDGLLTSTVRKNDSTNPSGDETTDYNYDYSGKLIKRTRRNLAAAFIDYYYYDAQGRQVGSVDEKGYFSETIYEPSLFKTTTKRYLNKITGASPLTELSVLRSSGGTAITSTQLFDRYGRITEVTTQDSGTTKYFYDGQGRLVRTSEQLTTGRDRSSGALTTNTVNTFVQYNVFGEVVGRVSGSGAVGLSELYGTAAATTTLTNTVFNTIKLKGKRISYDLMGRVISEVVATKGGDQATVDASAQKTFYFYDQNGRVSYVANALGEVSRTIYTAFGQVFKTTVFNTRLVGANLSSLTGGGDYLIADKVVASDADSTIQHSYNYFGSLTWTLNAAGEESGNTYGDFNERSVSYGTAPDSMLFWDKFGRSNVTLLKWGPNANDSFASEVRGFDALNRLTFASDGMENYTVTSYNAGGSEVVVNNFAADNTLLRSTKTTYDALSRITSSEDGMGQATSYGYAYEGAVRKITITTPEGTTVTTWYNEKGDKLQVTDANGKTTNYTYTLDGQLDTVTDGNGVAIEDNNYDLAGRLIEVIDANNVKVAYDYDVANRTILRTVDPSGLNLKTGYTYSVKGEQLTVVEGKGTSEETTTSYVYYKNGRLKQTIVDSGEGRLNLSTILTYDRIGNVVLVQKGTASAPAQTTTQYVYNKLGQKTDEIIDSVDGGLKLTTQYNYDFAGNLTRVIDANNNKTWNFYDGANRLIRTINPEGGVTEFFYNKNNQIWKTVQRAIPFENSLLGLVGPKNQITGYPSVTAADPANDRTTIAVFNNDGRQTHTITDTGNDKWTVTQTKYDPAGNVIATYRYNQTLADADISGFAADGQITVEELNGKSFNSPQADTRVTRYAYDANNRLRFTVNGEGYVTQNTYDSVGRVRFIKEYTDSYDTGGSDPNLANLVNWASGAGGKESLNTADVPTFRQTEYQYDTAGRQIKTILPGYYDPAGGKVSSVDGSGYFQRTIEVTYDVLGNAVINRIKTGASATSIITQYKTYDAAGRVVFDIDGLGYATKYEYDGLSNVHKTIRYNKVIDAAKDRTASGQSYWSTDSIQSNVATLTAPSIRTSTTEYDKVGRKTTVTQDTSDIYYGGTFDTPQTPFAAGSGAPETRYEYTGTGQVSVMRVRVRAGIPGEWANTFYYYDKAGRLYAQVQNNKDGSGAEKFFFTVNNCNSFGEVKNTTEYANGTGALEVAPMPSSADRITHFQYDKAGRLTKTLKSNIVFGTQSGSDWVSESVDAFAAKVVSSNTYNFFGELESSMDGINYAVDANNQTTRTTYTYDRLGNIKTITAPSRTTAGKESSSKDPFVNQANNVRPITTFIYNAFGQSITEEVDPGSVARGEKIIVHHKYDIAGNEIETTDGEGNISKKQYDVAGRVIKTQQTVNVTLSMSSLSYNNTIEQRYAYDAAGRQIATVDLYDGNQISGQYNYFNAFGEVTQEERIWGTTTNISGQSTQLTASEAKALADTQMSVSGEAATNSQTVNKYSYDNAGRIATKQSSDGTTYYYYDLTGKVTRSELRNSIDSSKRITEAYYDLRGNVLKQRLPSYTGTDMTNTQLLALSLGTTGDVALPAGTEKLLTPTVTQSFDRWGNVVKNTDVAGHVTEYVYNHANQVIKETEKSVDTWKINSAGNDLEALTTDIVHNITYNLQGQLATEEYSSSVQILGDKRYKFNVYDNVGQLSKTSDWVYKNTVNSSRNQTNIIAEVYAYDALGNRVGTRTAMGIVTVDSYDKNNRHLSKSIVRNTLNGVKMQWYNPAVNNPITLTVLSSTKYDQAGHVYSESSGMSPTVYKYNDRGLMIESKQALRARVVEVWKWIPHDNEPPSREYLRSYVEPLVDPQVVYPEFTEVKEGIYHQAYFTYDRFGNKATSTDKDGSQKSFTYSASDFQYGRMLTKTVGLADGPGVTYKYSYTGFGQVKQEEQVNDSTNYVSTVYTENGLLKSKTDWVGYTIGSQSFSAEFTYDIRGNRVKETNTTTTVEPLSWTTVIFPTKATQINLFGYDSMGRLTYSRSPSRELKIGNETIQSGQLNVLEYRYDEWGNRSEIIGTYTQTYTGTVAPIQKTDKEFYTYEATGRLLFENTFAPTTGINYSVDPARKGKAYSYDLDGRLAVIENDRGTGLGTPSGTIPGNTYYQHRYKYNDLNQVIEHSQGVRFIHASAPVQWTQASYTDTYNLLNYVWGQPNGSDFRDEPNIETTKYNDVGYRTSYLVSGQTEQIYSYNIDGSLSLQIDAGSTPKNSTTYTYNNLGKLSSYRTSSTDSSSNVITNEYTNAYEDTYAGSQVKSTAVVYKKNGVEQANITTGKTDNFYDLRGRLMSSAINQISGSNSGPGYKNFTYNADSFIIGTTERRYGETSYKAENFFYFQGSQLASINKDKADISPLSLVNMGSATPSGIVVGASDTLAGMAQSIYGDSSLWYVIADANGLTMGPSQVFAPADVGRTLTIPNSSQTIKNNSTTFKPYNPTEIIGDLTPEPTILPPPKQSCNGLAIIIMVVVAVVLTVITAGAAAMAMGAAGTGLGGALTAGGLALTGGLGAGMTAVGIASAAIGGFVGSVGSQLVGKALGVVEHFSLRQAVGSGLTAGFASGAGAYLSTLGTDSLLTATKLLEDGTTKVVTGLNAAGNMVRGAAGYLGAYASNKIAGLETHFNWTDMAVASISSGITGKTGQISDIGGATGSIGSNFIGNLWGSTVSSSLSRLMGRGEKQDWGMMAADAFGNALGSAVVSSAIDRAQQKTADKIRKGGSAALTEYLEKAGMKQEDIDAFKKENEFLLSDIDNVRKWETELGKNIEDMTLQETQMALGGAGGNYDFILNGQMAGSDSDYAIDPLKDVVNRAAGLIERTSKGVNWMVDKLGGERNAAAAVFGLQALIGGVPRAVVNLAMDTVKDSLFGDARAYATEKVGGLIAEHFLGVNDSITDVEYAKNATTLGNSIADFGISTIVDKASGVIKSSKGVGSARMSMAPEGAANVTNSAKPSLSAYKKALKEVQKEVGKLPKGKPGKFGSPQAGDGKKGYRLDPPHDGVAKGDAESKYHINWWDFTGGKREKGGRWGAISIED